MKRLAALALALCLAAPAYAKVLVVTSTNTVAPEADPGAFLASEERYSHVASTLSSLGIDYDVMSSRSLNAKTEFFRTGTVVYDFGTPAARAVSYSAIIHVGSAPLFGTVGPRYYRPDSLTLIGPSQPRAIKYVQVPNIFMQYNGTALSEGTTVADSTLLKNQDNTNTSILGQTCYAPGTTATYRPGVAKVIETNANVSSWAGGSRILIRAGTGDGVFTNDIYQRIPRPKGDSLLTGFRSQSQTPLGDSDTCIVFAKKFDNIPACNGAALLFVQDSDFNTSQMDPVAFLTALTYADSLTGGAIYATAKRMPAKLGLQIRGAFSRGHQLGWPTSTGGMTGTDSTNFIASIDSLASLNIPFVVGVNVDSISTYANYDGRWWLRAPTAKFGVYQTSGAMGLASTNGTATPSRPLDIFGLTRARFAYGDSLVHSVDTGDTSITQLVRGAFSALSTQFGSGKVDRVLMAPNDTWKPQASTVTFDSMLFALRKGGARGLTINPSRGMTRGIQYTTEPRRLMVRLADAGTDFTLLATTGLVDSGSVRFDISSSANQQHVWNSFQESVWRGLLQDMKRVPVVTVTATGNGHLSDSTHFVVQRSNIMTIHCADLGSGTRQDAAKLPLRSAWHVVKNISRGMDTVNKYAWKGRKVVMFAYPQDIEP